MLFMSVTSHVNASGSASITGVSIPDHTPPGEPVYVDITIEYNVPAGEIIWPGIWDNQKDALQETIALRVDGSGRETITADFKPPTEEGTYVYTSFVEVDDGTGWIRIDGPTFTVIVSANGSAGTVEGGSSGGSDAPDVMWEKIFGGTSNDEGYSVQITDDGGYIITGMTYSSGAGQADVYLVKIDSSGNLEWEKTFGGTNIDEGYSVQVTTDGGYIITGVTYSFGAGGPDVYLIKTDSDGDLEWFKTFGGTGWDQGNSVQLTDDGGYIIVGRKSTSMSGGNVYLVKTDSNGNLVWEKTFGSTGYDDGYSVQTTDDGGYIITGEIYSFGSGYLATEVYLLKTDSDGNQLWSKMFGGTSVDRGYSVQVASDGGYIITGMTVPAGSGWGDVYLLKTDSDGTLEWEKTFGGTEKDEARSVQLTSDGGYIISGFTHSSGAVWGDVYLIKTDSSGNLVWEKTIGGTGKDYGYSVQITDDDEYILAGKTDSSGVGGNDVYLIKTGTQGEVIIQEETYSASLVSVEAPNEVYVGDAITVELTVSYEFTVPTAMSSKIFDAGTEMWIAEDSDTLVGTGTKTYSFELTAPTEEGTLALEASVWYISEGELIHDETDWSELFSIDVIEHAQIVLTDDQSDWPMFQRDNLNAGYKGTSAPQTNTLLWSNALIGEIWMGPAVANGKVYQGSYDQTLTCFDAFNGSVLWTFSTNSTVNTTPLIWEGYVYFGTDDSTVYCLDAETGTKIWQVESDSPPSMGRVRSNPVIQDSKLVIGRDDHNLYGYDALTGEELWRNTAENGFDGDPAIKDGKVYIGHRNGMLYCYDLETGLELWSYQTGTSITGGPSIDGDRLYIANSYGLTGTVLSFDISSTELIWSYTTQGQLHGTPAIGPSYVYVGSTANILYCIDKDTGSLVWEYTASAPIYSSAVLAGNSVYFGVEYTGLVCLNAQDGSFVWEEREEWAGTNAPAIAYGNIYAGFRNTLKVFGENTGISGNITNPDDSVYYAGISDLTYPSEVEIGEEVTIMVSVDYEFPGAARLIVDVDDGTDTLNSVSEEVAWDGSAQYTLSFVAPSEPGEYSYTVTVTYIADDIADRSDDGVQEFTITVLPSDEPNEPRYYAGITDLSYPSEVETGEAISVTVSVDYEFPGEVTLFVEVNDETDTLDSTSELVSWDGSGKYALSFDAPSEAGEYSYTVIVSYVAGDIEDMSDDGVEEFTVNVVSSGGSGVSDIIEQTGIPGFPAPALLLGIAAIALMLNTKPRKHH